MRREKKWLLGKERKRKLLVLHPNTRRDQQNLVVIRVGDAELLCLLNISSEPVSADGFISIGLVFLFIIDTGKHIFHSVSPPEWSTRVSCKSFDCGPLCVCVCKHLNHVQLYRRIYFHLSAVYMCVSRIQYKAEPIEPPFLPLPDWVYTYTGH